MVVGYSSKVDTKLFGAWSIPHRKGVPCTSRDALERITMKVQLSALQPAMPAATLCSCCSWHSSNILQDILSAWQHCTAPSLLCLTCSSI